jgi:hypothetical protein
MKKGVLLLSILSLFLIANFSFVLADDAEKINEAYTCFLNNVKDKCSTLTPEARIFSMLAMDLCKNETLSLAKDLPNEQTCWPATAGGACSIKTTALAIIAMQAAGEDTEEAENWLLAQKAAPPDLTWYLQIESNQETTCTINYNGNSYTTTIGTDKKPTRAAGSCLVIDSDYPYWLKITNSTSCLTAEYQISCDKSFISNFLYKKTGSTTIFVSSQTSTENPVKKEIESFCFKEGDSCNLEGSLWATVVLDFLNYDMTSFKPWLVATASQTSNSSQQYLPQAFLWHLLDGRFPEYQVQLLDMRKPSSNKKYWEQSSGNRYYDTALAIYFLDSGDDAVNTAKTWLLSNRGNDDCWGSTNKVRDTAFVLYSAFPGQYVPPEPECSEDKPCIDGYECTENQTCVRAPECRQDPQCSSGVCINNYCKDCRNDTSCGSGMICAPNNTCIEGCRQDNQCAPGVCIGNQCKECRFDTQCQQGQICSGNTCVDGCRNDTQCSSLNLGTNFCLIPGNTCVECVNNGTKGCPSGERCISNVCVPEPAECEIDANCPLEKVCNASGKCEPGCGFDDSKCALNKFCADTGLCAVGCRNDSICTGSNKACVDNVCVACRYDDDCGTGKVCTEDNTCVQCIYDVDCIDLGDNFVCNETNNRCFELPECNPPSLNCTEGYQCINRTCYEIPPEPECNATISCDEGYRCVGNLCEIEPECDPPSINCSAGYYCDDNYCYEDEPGDECTYDFDCEEIYGEGWECDNDLGECFESGTEENTCEDAGLFCRSVFSCNEDGGNVFDEDEYTCDGLDRCCDTDTQTQSCEDMGGNRCDTDEVCSPEGNSIDDATDLLRGETCCVGGSCIPEEQSSECEEASGACRSSCYSGETESSESCTDSEDVCCMSIGSSDCTSDDDCNEGEFCNDDGVCELEEEGSYLWIWILLILIILVVLGILFRNKLTGLFLRMKPSKPRFPPPPGFPRPMPMSSGPVVRRPMPIMRRILPPGMQRPMPPKPPVPPSTPEKPTTPTKDSAKKPEEKKGSELEDVLKKLKDISK